MIIPNILENKIQTTNQMVVVSWVMGATPVIIHFYDWDVPLFHPTILDTPVFGNPQMGKKNVHPIAFVLTPIGESHSMSFCCSQACARPWCRKANHVYVLGSHTTSLQLDFLRDPGRMSFVHSFMSDTYHLDPSGNPAPPWLKHVKAEWTWLVA